MHDGMQCTKLRRYCRQAHLARWDDCTFAAFTTSGVNCAEQRGLTHNAAPEQRPVHQRLAAPAAGAWYISGGITAASLPLDVLCNILGRLRLEERYISAALVCKAWRAAVDSPQLLRRVRI
ncbi:hypothetical protein ABPG77_005918 [Micractinium sp. CCAP 211/92]